MLGHASFTLSPRRVKNHAQCRSDVIPACDFCRDSRPSPSSRQVSSLAHGAGNGRRSSVVRYAPLRSRISTGYGPEDITRLRRFALGVIKSKEGKRVPRKMRQLAGHVRRVFDYLRLSENSGARHGRNQAARPNEPVVGSSSRPSARAPPCPVRPPRRAEQM